MKQGGINELTGIGNGGEERGNTCIAERKTVNRYQRRQHEGEEPRPTGEGVEKLTG